MSELHFNSLSGASVGWHLVGECVCVCVCVCDHLFSVGVRGYRCESMERERGRGMQCLSFTS